MPARTSFDSQKSHEDEVFFQRNIVSKCTKHHKYVDSQMAVCALEFIAYHCIIITCCHTVVICGKIGSMSSSPRNFLFLKIVDCIHGIFWSKKEKFQKIYYYAIYYYLRISSSKNQMTALCMFENPVSEMKLIIQITNFNTWPV